MSLLHLLKCDACEKTHPFDPMFGPAFSQAPDDWLTLVYGNPQVKEGYTFCSKEHLFEWIVDHWKIGDGFEVASTDQSNDRENEGLIDKIGRQAEKVSDDLDRYNDPSNEIIHHSDIHTAMQTYLLLQIYERLGDRRKPLERES